MFHSALRIALSKASTAEERAALEQALAAAEELEHVESDFEGKINASKAARGEKPTNLSKARRAQVRGYAEDAAAMSKEQLSVLQAELGASEIVNALHVGLQSDLQFWNGAAKYTHPSDMPVLEEFVAAKQRLFEALEHYRASRVNAADRSRLPCR